MNRQLKRYLPIALCCLPGIAIALLVSTGVSLGGLLNVLPTGVADLACPVAMVLMLIMIHRQENSEKNQAADLPSPTAVRKLGKAFKEDVIYSDG